MTEQELLEATAHARGSLFLSSGKTVSFRCLTAEPDDQFATFYDESGGVSAVRIADIVFVESPALGEK